MPHSSKENISIGWCDNGNTDGKFTEGLVYTTLMAPQHNIPIGNAIRVQGNQIGRQRQVLWDMWLDNIKTDWLLWVDSDIVLTIDVMKLLWETADKIARPVVCGVYFISKETESSMMMPMPALFDEVSEFSIKYHHPLHENQIIKVDNAGLGLTLVHRSVGLKLREVHGNISMYAEKEGLGSEFIGEDIVFFRNIKAAGIPVVAHTGAKVKHMKRFSYDDTYYKIYWAAAKAQAAAEAQSGNSTSK